MIFRIRKHWTNVRVSYLLLALIFFTTSLPVNSKVYFLEAQYYQDKTQDKKIILGKAEIITSDQPIARIAVSDPNIADLQILNEKQIFVRAKQLGKCTFLVWEKGKPAPARFDISVWPDIEYLTKQLQELDKNITVEYIPPLSNIAAGTPQLGGEQFPESGALPGAEGQEGAQAGASEGGVQGGQAAGGTASLAQEKIILKGEVENAEVIAKALQIAGAYVDDQGIRVISQPGGQIIDGLVGDYTLRRNSDGTGGGAGGGSGTQFGAREQISFTSNSRANLSRSTIVTTQRGRVLSFLTVKNPRQISIAIKFYEISRSLSRDLGFNQAIGGSTLQGGAFVGGNNLSQPIGGAASIAGLSQFTQGQAGQPPTFAFSPGNAAGSFLGQALGGGVTGAIFNPENGIGLVIQALQQRGEVKALAEPTLVITNGEPASFLAGGEVPIQRSVISTGGAGQDIQYEPFGIRFTILPTITTNNKIHLQLVPEIRDIDTELSNLVAPASSTTLRPPAFKTRRTQTQVELQSGQAFAISGLMREDNTRNIRKMPGIGEIPILGSLFRSKSFRRGETELLIVVSPVIVEPAEPEKIAAIETKTKDVPYNEFNQLPPFRKSFKYSIENLHDEKGPSGKEPINPGRIFPPPEKRIEPPSTPLIQEEPAKLEELKQEVENLNIPVVSPSVDTVKPIEQPKPQQGVIEKSPELPGSPKPVKPEEILKLRQEVKPEEKPSGTPQPAQQGATPQPASTSAPEQKPEQKKEEKAPTPKPEEKPATPAPEQEPATPKPEQMIEAPLPPPMSDSKEEEELPLGPVEFHGKEDEEKTKEEPQMQKSGLQGTIQGLESILYRKFKEDNLALQERQDRAISKLEQEKRALEKEQAKLLKKFEEKKQNILNEHTRAIREKQANEQAWMVESINYLKAKEAMRLARENKTQDANAIIKSLEEQYKLNDNPDL